MRSHVHVRANERTAAFLRAVALNVSSPLVDTIDAFRMIDPPSRKKRERLLHREKQPLHVDVEDIVEMFLRYLAQAGEFAAPAFANTTSTLPFSPFTCPKRRSRSAVGDVASDSGDIASDLLYHRRQLRLTATRYEDVSAFGDEPLPWPGRCRCYHPL